MKFTRHAEIRRQQRGFPPFITDTILQFGVARNAAGEATMVFLGNRAAPGNYRGAEACNPAA